MEQITVIQFPFIYQSNYGHLLCLRTVIICQQSGVASLKIELLTLLSNDLLTIICDLCWVVTYRKQNMSNFWPKKWSRSLKKFEWWSLTRELLHKTVLYEVVAYGRWSLTRSSRYERVVCITHFFTFL